MIKNSPFNIIGEVTLKKYDSRTNELTQEIVKNNVFTKFGMALAMNLLGGGAFFSPIRVAISTSTVTPDKGTHSISGLNGYGETPEGVSQTQLWTPKTEDNASFGTVLSRIPFWGETKTFRTLGIYQHNFNSSWKAGFQFTTANFLAYVKFEEDVVQEPFEFIDIFYRCYFINNQGEGLSANGALTEAIGKTLFGIHAGSPAYNFSLNYITSIDNPHDYNYIGTHTFDDVNSSGVTNSADISQLNFEDLTYTINVNTPNRESNVGRLYKSYCALGTRSYNDTVFNKTIIDPALSPIQTSWAKRENGKPFYDTNEISFGDGSVEMQGNWTGDYPEFYRAIITQSGNINNATYRLQKMNFTQFYGNDWRQSSAVIPHLNAREESLELVAGGYGTTRLDEIEKYDDRKLVFWNSEGVTLLDVLDSTFIKFWGNNTESGFPNGDLGTTNITQVCVKDGDIYVACKDTGLWKIYPDLTSNSVIHEVDDPCYGVSVTNFSGVLDVYAVFSSGITYEGSNWVSFYTPTISLDWTTIDCLVGNPHNTSGEFAIMGNLGGFAKIIWWRVQQSTSVEAYSFEVSTKSNSSQYVTPEPSSIKPSPTGDWWAVSFEQFFNSNGTTNTYWGSMEFDTVGMLNTHFLGNYRKFASGDRNASAIKPEFTPDGKCLIGATGITPTMYYLTKDNGIMATSSYNISTGNVVSGDNKRYKIIHLRDNIYFVGGHLFVLYDPQWVDMGWENGVWVENSVTPKTVHPDYQDIGQGLQIRFNDNGSANPYFATDFYTLPVAYGLLGDNSKTFTFSMSLTGNAVNWQQNIPNSQVVPNATPHEYQLQVTGNLESIIATDPQAIKIFIDGIEVPFDNFVVDAIPPSSGFIGINTLLGTLRFHPDDANKTIIGYYSYISSLV